MKLQIDKILLFILLLNILLLSPLLLFSEVKVNEVNLWLTKLEKSKLKIPDSQINDLIHKDPNLITKEKKLAIKKYNQLLTEIEKKRVSLAKKYKNVKKKQQEKIKILKIADEYISSIIEKLLFPLWAGGDWEFDGVPKKIPDPDRPVACGHFVQKILSDTGFNIKKNGTTWLAYLSPINLVKTFSKSQNKVIDFKNWKNLKKNLLDIKGSGIYIFGLECGSGHVLLGRYNKKKGKLLFMHSGPHPDGASVNYDDGKSYIEDYCGNKIWANKFDESIIEKWFLKKVIKPNIEMK